MGRKLKAFEGPTSLYIQETEWLSSSPTVSRSPLGGWRHWRPAETPQERLNRGESRAGKLEEVLREGRDFGYEDL